jgi:hypothetical protein
VVGSARGSRAVNGGSLPTEGSERRRHLPDPGWYPDPEDEGQEVLRWWDGRTWTEHRHPRPGADPTPVSAVAPSWHPDPSGRPGIERWWDGTQWSEQTRPTFIDQEDPTAAATTCLSTDLSTPAPLRSWQGSGSGSGLDGDVVGPWDRRRWLWVLGIIALVIAAAVALNTSHERKQAERESSDIP